MHAYQVPVELFFGLAREMADNRWTWLSEGSKVKLVDIDPEKAGGFGGSVSLIDTTFLDRPMSIFKLWWKRPTPEQYSDILSPEVLTIRGRLLDSGLWAYGSGTKYVSDVDVEMSMKASFRNITIAGVRFVGEVLARTAELSRNVEREVVWAGEKTEMP